MKNTGFWFFIVFYNRSYHAPTFRRLQVQFRLQIGDFWWLFWRKSVRQIYPTGGLFACRDWHLMRQSIAAMGVIPQTLCSGKFPDCTWPEFLVTSLINGTGSPRSILPVIAHLVTSLSPQLTIILSRLCARGAFDLSTLRKPRPTTGACEECRYQTAFFPNWQ